MPAIRKISDVSANFERNSVRVRHHGGDDFINRFLWHLYHDFCDSLCHFHGRVFHNLPQRIPKCSDLRPVFDPQNDQNQGTNTNTGDDQLLLVFLDPADHTFSVLHSYCSSFSFVLPVRGNCQLYQKYKTWPQGPVNAFFHDLYSFFRNSCAKIPLCHREAFHCAVFTIIGAVFLLFSGSCYKNPIEITQIYNTDEDWLEKRAPVDPDDFYRTLKMRSDELDGESENT